MSDFGELSGSPPVIRPIEVIGSITKDQPTCHGVALDGGSCSPCERRAAIFDQIKQLKAKYDAIGTARNAIHDPFIHKLPPEIGSHILRLSLPTVNEEKYYQEIIRGPDSVIWAAPLKLGSVCRKWRQLTWATPNLWTTLYIEINPSMTHSIAESLPGLLREWLGLSGVLPLTIYFLHRDWYSSSEGELPNYVKTHRTAYEVATALAIDILRLHSGRWRNLYLKGSAGILERFSRTASKQLVGLGLSARLPCHGPRPLPEFMIESKLNLTPLRSSVFL
jgi:hypothetical protein